MLATKPVSTTTIKIHLTAEKIAFKLSPEINREPTFAAAFPSGAYLNIDVHTLSNGRTALTLADTQPELTEAGLNSRTETVIDSYLNAVAEYL